MWRELYPINMQFLLYLFILSVTVSYTTTTSDVLLTKFNITIKTPGKELPPKETPYKSIHVKYTLSNSSDRWAIVAIEPSIRKSKEFIQQISVHLCQAAININQPNAIWYDDDTYCNGARSMLIYQWASYSLVPNFQVADDLGIQLDKSRFIVLTVTYFQEQQSHNHSIRIILSMSTLIPRFYVGTILIGNKQRGIRFSCRSLNYPRLLYAVKLLFPKTHNDLWRIYVIRSRNFGRKLVQLVVNSTMYLKDNQTDFELVSSDAFLIPGDYLIVECTQVFESNCQFLIYYTHKNLPYKFFDEDDQICQTDNHPDLFKLLPLEIIIQTNITSSYVSNFDGTTIFLLICALLVIIWISIIIGCVIMRRIRGLVNFRTEPSTPRSGQSTKAFFPQRQTNNDQNQQKIMAEGDHIAQLDIEHMGLMS